MTRNEAIELLEKYQKLLYEKGYINDDYWQDNPHALDQFLNTKRAKENIPIGTKFGRLFNVIDA